MPSKPGPGYWWNAQPSGQWSPVAFGPLSGPLHLRRSKLPRWPLASDTHTTPFVDVAAAQAEAGHRDVVDFRQRGLGRVGAGNEPHDRARAGAQTYPDRAVDRARHHRVEHLGDPPVLGRIGRLVGLDIVVALAVAVGVEDERRPALRLRRIAGLVEHLGVDPADHAAAAAAAVHSVSLAS